MIDVSILPQTDAPQQPTPGFKARAQRAAGMARVELEKIEALPFDLSAVEQEGVFVNVDARGFGLLDRRLEWQALGITLPRGSDLAFRPPRCGLLPDRYRLPLLRPAQRAHAALHKYSYRFTLAETLFETPAYRYVPWRAFPAFEEEFQAAQAALEAAKAEVLERSVVLREEVVDVFLKLATDSARRFEATGHGVAEGFVDAVVHGVLRAMPRPEDLREKLMLRYQVGVIFLGSEMLAEQRRAREERRQLLETESALRIERQRQEGRERLVQEELWAEQERIRQRLRAEAEELRREGEVKERLRRLKLEAAKERFQQSLSPIEEGARQLHAAIYESALAIRASLQKHRRLPGASAKRARELARWFSLMNWQSDRQLEALIAELESLAARPTGKQRRDPGPIDQVLGDIIAVCYADARALAEPHRMAALEL